MTDDEDDLEQRKQDMWSMDEVRGSGSATTEPTGSGAEEIPNGSDAGDAPQSDDVASDQPPESASRNQQSAPSDTADTTEGSQTADTSQHATGDTVRQMAIDAEAKDLAVRDLHNVNVYLYESIYREMVATFKDLDSEYFQQHGDDLSKNKAFFNAVFRAGLNSPQLREELELE